jgi:NTP pyrophosphatase (non-canonical NTP hydrolase)
MTSDEYQQWALALESSEDDTLSTPINTEAVGQFVRAARLLDFSKREAFYTKKPDGARREKDRREMLEFGYEVASLNRATWGQTQIDPRVLHGAIGIATEAGEIFESLVSSASHVVPADETNLAEEIGDVLWYCALLADAIGTDLAAVMRQNVAKLEARYGDGKVHGGERDLAAERAAMEGAK